MPAAVPPPLQPPPLPCSGRSHQDGGSREARGPPTTCRAGHCPPTCSEALAGPPVPERWCPRPGGEHSTQPRTARLAEGRLREISTSGWGPRDVLPPWRRRNPHSLSSGGGPPFLCPPCCWGQARPRVPVPGQCATLSHASLSPPSRQAVPCRGPLVTAPLTRAAAGVTEWVPLPSGGRANSTARLGAVVRITAFRGCDRGSGVERSPSTERHWARPSAPQENK